MEKPSHPLWVYLDAIGRNHMGHLDRVLDGGRTYMFRDSTTGEFSVISGTLLRDNAHRLWED
ncbi:hypothetical protein LCGC14_2893050 [marine sediment metagenome]|uniref:Uncharacterized protein n=1 Tax=marine sediment metagenome TaxID=412755 RepID=A0A0F9A4K0_9ZZZZ